MLIVLMFFQFLYNPLSSISSSLKLMLGAIIVILCPASTINFDNVNARKDEAVP